MSLKEEALKFYYFFLTIPIILKRAPIFLNGSRPPTDYIHLALKLLKINFGHKVPIYGSADITNRCNLKCKHCYWWKNWKSSNELSPEQWRVVIREKFKKTRIYQVALTGGEPLLRPEVIEVFNEELPNKLVIVSNGTLPLIDFGRVSYFVSLDGTEKIHDSIRGSGTYKKIKQHVKDYNGLVYSNTTINALNCDSIEDLVEEWSGLLDMMNFQFHTPFNLDDKLWVPFGKKRDEIVDRILKLKQEYPDLFLNTEMQLNLLRSNKWVSKCPNWAFLSLNHLGQVKQPCLLGGENKPICERCGMCEEAGMYVGLYQFDLEWLKIQDNIVFKN